MATRGVADQPSMKGYDPDLGLGAKVPTSISNAITKSVGTKRVTRKSAPAIKTRTPLIRTSMKPATKVPAVNYAPNADALKVAATKLLNKK